MLLQLPQILFFLRKRHPVFVRRGFRINLMALSILSVILGIIGLILAGNAKKLGLSEEYRLQDLSITAALLDFSWLLFCMQGVIKFHIPT